ncbi:helix-turn-helix domain-containing protein [Salibacterium sp. K-3]
MIGIRIRYERHEQALTIAELAEKAGIEEEVLRAVEEGEDRMPAFSELEKVAGALRLPAASLTPAEETLESEWIDLVETAMKSGVTKDDFRQFLNEEKRKRKET